jgi:hypothetical protein
LLQSGSLCSYLEDNYAACLLLSYNHGHGLSLLEGVRQATYIYQRGRGNSLKTVLEDYNLKPKDKVMLAYAIARSYWKYYHSELMRVGWTTDTVFLMKEDDVMRDTQRLPLCAYIPIPMGNEDQFVPEYFDNRFLVHKCRRIFNLGLLLLAVGLGKPLPSLESCNTVQEMNLNHKRAVSHLEEFKRMNWEGLISKARLDSVIEFCLQEENFSLPLRHSKTDQSKGKSSLTPAVSDNSEYLTKRRAHLYDKVVAPLAWLARKGFRTQPGDAVYVESRQPREPLSSFTAVSEPEAVFHSSHTPELWLEDLRKISELVELKRREHKVSAPVRIAILDTGLDESALGLPLSPDTIVDKRDFVDPAATIMTDTFGHGTFMTRLILECSPGANIIIARVARNTSELGGSRENIKSVGW